MTSETPTSSVSWSELQLRSINTLPIIVPRSVKIPRLTVMDAAAILDWVEVPVPPMVPTAKARFVAVPVLAPAPMTQM